MSKNTTDAPDAFMVGRVSKEPLSTFPMSASAILRELYDPERYLRLDVRKERNRIPGALSFPRQWSIAVPGSNGGQLKLVNTGEITNVDYSYSSKQGGENVIMGKFDPVNLDLEPDDRLDFYRNFEECQIIELLAQEQTTFISALEARQTRDINGFGLRYELIVAKALAKLIHTLPKNERDRYISAKNRLKFLDTVGRGALMQAQVSPLN